MNSEGAEWVESLSDENLRTVLWLLGEFMGRAAPVLHFIRNSGAEDADRQHQALLQICIQCSQGVETDRSSRPLVSQGLRDEMKVSKHMRWAADRTDAELYQVLCTLPEIVRQCEEIFRQLKRELQTSEKWGAFFRGAFAGTQLVEFVKGDRFSVDAHCARLAEAMSGRKE